MPKAADKRCSTLQNLSKFKNKYNIGLKLMVYSGLVMIMLLEIGHLN